MTIDVERMRTRRLELLRPDEILDEMRRIPVVYLPSVMWDVGSEAT
jgi:hypothetical protein